MRVVFVAFVAAALLASCGSQQDTTPLKELRRVKVGMLDVVLLSPGDTLQRGKGTFALEFRDAGGALVDVGTVTVGASMPMPGMAPMFVVWHRDDRIEVLACDASARERGPERGDDDGDPDDTRDGEHRPEEMIHAPVRRARGIENALRARARRREEQGRRATHSHQSSGGVLDIFGTAFGVDASGVFRIM